MFYLISESNKICNIIGFSKKNIFHGTDVHLWGFVSILDDFRIINDKETVFKATDSYAIYPKEPDIYFKMNTKLFKKLQEKLKVY